MAQNNQSTQQATLPSGETSPYQRQRQRYERRKALIRREQATIKQRLSFLILGLSVGWGMGFLLGYVVGLSS